MWTRQWLATSTFAFALAVGFSANAHAQTTKAKDKDKTSATKKDGKKPAKLTGRLPAYYRQVVDDAQRAKIYALQAKYRKDSNQISAEIEKLTRDLRKKLAELKKEESAEVEAVLTAAQKKKVDALRAEAAERRKEKSNRKQVTKSKQ